MTTEEEDELVESVSGWLYNNHVRWSPVAMSIPRLWEPGFQSPVYDIWRARGRALLEECGLLEARR